MIISSYYKLIMFAIIFISILLSIKKLLKKSDIDYVVAPIIGSVSTMISFFVILFNYDKIYIMISEILPKIIGSDYGSIGIIKLISIIVVFMIIRFFIQGILFLINKVIFSSGKRYINDNKILLIIFGSIFGIIRGAIFILMLFIPIVLFNSIPNNPVSMNIFDDVYAYRKVENLIDNNTSKIIDSGLIKDINSNKIIYYNGVTIEQGVKSNEVINNKALSLINSCKSDRERAKKIYAWVGTNIEYDDLKAEKVLNSQNVKDSGAISAFQNRSGICFDYACLYVAMCRAVGLNVRLVTGDAYNGEEYISHAWNEVYLKDENKWINVDPTFYKAGNYFDSKDFNETHRKNNTAGEW